ncbi:MAG: outer membrane protein [Myxococcales bacterium]
MRLSVLPAALAAALFCLPEAAAEPVAESTRIALQAGWRLAPNARFGELADAAGHPLVGPSAGGPGVLGVFGYRTSRQLEIALEIGWATETFGFEDSTLSLTHMPLAVAARWAPWPGDLLPYFGGGVGYFLNFFSGGPIGSLESHGGGPFALAGVSWQLADRFGLIAEYRLGLARVELPGLGWMQTGGNWFCLGAQYAFAPERRRLK